jgi:hypothetical protein
MVLDQNNSCLYFKNYKRQGTKMELQKSKLADYVRRWGNSASTTLFNSNCLIFSVPGLDGLVGYRIDSNYAIVFGEPLCD